MNIPYFFTDPVDPAATGLSLPEAQARHALQVLRLRVNDPVILTDGQGKRIHGQIADIAKKSCFVRITHTDSVPPARTSITIGLSLLKHSDRFEWFLEKVTELGIQEIIPLSCARTERLHFRMDRMRAIRISALLQSQQCWLPVLREPLSFQELIQVAPPQALKLIAHCAEGAKEELFTSAPQPNQSCLMLIGPEGDFTPEEIQLAVASGFHPVTLGATRLRTETAGITAAVLLRQLFSALPKR